MASAQEGRALFARGIFRHVREKVGWMAQLEPTTYVAGIVLKSVCPSGVKVRRKQPIVLISTLTIHVILVIPPYPTMTAYPGQNYHDHE